MQTEVGLSDFTIDLVVGVADRPDEPLLAVLLDGPGWAARRTVGDRDGLPVEVLSKLMHWPAVERVWLPEWLADTGGVLDRLAEVVKTAAAARVVAEEADRAAAEVAADAGAHPDGPAAAGAAAVGFAAEDGGGAAAIAEPAPDPPPAQSAATGLPGEALFSPWLPGTIGSRDQLDLLPGPVAARQVSKALVDAVEAEGPIEIDRLVRLVAAGFGLHRVVATRHAAILAQLPIGLIADPVTPEFAWPARLDPLTWNGFRRTPPSDSARFAPGFASAQPADGWGVDRVSSPAALRSGRFGSRGRLWCLIGNLERAGVTEHLCDPTGTELQFSRLRFGLRTTSGVRTTAASSSTVARG